MKTFTYRELLNNLLTLTDTQLSDTVTVYHHDEYIPAKSCAITLEDDVLDADHFYLISS